MFGMGGASPAGVPCSHSRPGGRRQPSRFKNAMAASGARALSPEMKYTKQSRPDALPPDAGPASFRSATNLPAAQLLARAAQALRAAES